MPGEKWGNWIIISETMIKNKFRACLCRCDCKHKTETTVKNTKLLDKTSTSCGKCNLPLPGEIYNRLTVLKESDKTDSKSHRYYICECSCDQKTITEVRGNHLVRGDVKSCGCLSAECWLKGHSNTNSGSYSLYNKLACKVIEDYGVKHGYNFQHAENGGEYRIRRYFVDAYENDENIVLEVDESHHYRAGKLKRKDVIRQRRIMQAKKCTFIRIRIDCNGQVLGEPIIYKPGDLPELYSNNGLLQI